jgi:hypothetical protein
MGFLTLFKKEGSKIQNVIRNLIKFFIEWGSKSLALARKINCFESVGGGTDIEGKY